MSVLKNLLRKLKARKEASQEYERERRIEERYSERKLSANERELMRWREKDRQERIKRELERRRKTQQRKIWSGKEGNPAYLPNVMRNHKKIFRQKNVFIK